jgi:hypothetical protein
MSLTVDVCSSSARTLLQNTESALRLHRWWDVSQRGGGRQKKSPQGFLRRFIYHAKTREKSQMNEKIVEKQALAGRIFSAKCLIFGFGVDVVLGFLRVSECLH